MQRDLNAKILLCNVSCFNLGDLELCLGGLNPPKPTRGDGTGVNVLLHSLTAAVFPWPISVDWLAIPEVLEVTIYNFATYYHNLTLNVSSVCSPSENFYPRAKCQRLTLFAESCFPLRLLILFSYRRWRAFILLHFLPPKNTLGMWHWLGMVLRVSSQLLHDWVSITDIYIQIECSACGRWIHRVCTKLKRVPPRYLCSICTSIQWHHLLLSQCSPVPEMLHVKWLREVAFELTLLQYRRLYSKFKRS